MLFRSVIHYFHNDDPGKNISILTIQSVSNVLLPGFRITRAAQIQADSLHQVAYIQRKTTQQRAVSDLLFGPSDPQAAIHYMFSETTSNCAHRIAKIPLESICGTMSW